MATQAAAYPSAAPWSSLIESHRDDVLSAGKPGKLLARTATRAMVKFDSGAVIWLDSDAVPPTPGEAEADRAAQAHVEMLRHAGTRVTAQRSAP